MVDFDILCDDYEERLNKDLKIFGEDHQYFVELKVSWIKEFLNSKKIDLNLKILEVGCGIGSLNKYIRQHLPHATYCGIDISLRSIEKANQANKDFSASYYCRYDGRNIPFKDGSFNIVILAGLLHHILPEDRLEILRKIYQVSNVNGYIFIFEHNIYNPVVRYIVKKCAIDHDANLLALNAAIGYLSKCNFKAVRTDYIIFFPSLLKKLRFLERRLSWLPLGAQYALVGKKTNLADRGKKVQTGRTKMRIFMKVPRQIKEGYAHLGLLARLYIPIRWKACPFEIIENYVPKNGLILDIGCGCGLFSNWMAIKSQNRKIVGIDKSIRRINIARSTIKGRGNIAFFRADTATEEFTEECAGIVASDFFHHISDEDVITVLKKAHNKLSANGRLIIQDIDKKPLIKSFIAYAIDRIISPRSKLYHRSAERLKDLLSISGFESKLIPIHKGLFLPDILFICKKRKEESN